MHPDTQKTIEAAIDAMDNALIDVMKRAWMEQMQEARDNLEALLI